MATHVGSDTPQILEEMRVKSEAAAAQAVEDYRTIADGGISAIRYYPDRLKRAHEVAMENADFDAVQVISRVLTERIVARRAS